MAIIIIRTAIVYITILLALRLMGKRQLGQLELSELVGADRFLHLRYDHLDPLAPIVIARGSVHDRYPIGTKLWVKADMKMFLFFDNNSDMRIV